MSAVPRTRPPYPEEFRREAVALVRREGRSVPDVADALGCSQQALRNWLRQDQLDLGERRDGLTSEERSELRELRKKVRRLEQEREVLKQAAAFFASETR
jgi:transposase